jgi:hypothetical protein
MPMSEVQHIVDSCKKRGIYFSVIEITGGEVTLWENLEEGVEALWEITDDIFFVTNGNNPKRVINLGLKHWILSTSQATKEQIKEYKNYLPQMGVNGHAHKPVYREPILGTLPAMCVAGISPFNSKVRENSIEYLKGKVYYCNSIFPLSCKMPLTDDLVCDFEDDFLTKYKNRRFDKKVCQICLCNSRVWSRVPEVNRKVKINGKSLTGLFAEKGIGYYNTDKGTDHNYLKIYDRLFLPYKNKKINVFEAGFAQGGSCKLWEDYFTKANIRFIDYDKNCKLESTSGRVRLDIIEIGMLTTDYFNDFPPDIAIDDSSHKLNDQLCFIKKVYPALRKGGLLIVEDIINIEKYFIYFKHLGIPFEIMDQRKEQNRTDNVLLIFRK